MACVYVHNDGWELGDMSPVEYGQRLMDVPQDNGHSNILVNSLRICSCNKLCFPPLNNRHKIVQSAEV